MTTHARFEELAAAAIDFRLDPAEQTALGGHLETCSACRAAAWAYETDAFALRTIAFAEPPARVRSAVMAAATERTRRAVQPWKLLLAAAVLLGALVGAVLAVGAWNSRPSLVVVVPVPSPSAEPSVAVVEPSAAPSLEPTPYAPPAATCPSPASAVRIPDVTVSVGGGPGVVATRGSSTTVTCTTTGSEDVVPARPTTGVSAHVGDRLTLSLPTGWAFLHVESGDGPVTGDGGNVNAPIDTPDLPSQVDVPAPGRLGESIAGLNVWMIRDDGKVVGQLEILAHVQVGAAPSSAGPSPSPGGTTTLILPDAAIRTVSTTQPLWSSTAYGSRAFELTFDTSKAPTGGTLTMRDLVTGTSTNLARIDSTHSLAAMAAGEDRLVWVETWRDNPSPSPPTTVTPGCVDLGKPLRWQIVALTISTGASVTIDSGTNKRTAYVGECADVGAPLIAIDGDRLAYTVEAATTGQPLADRIVLRDLATGSIVKAIATDGTVEDLQLSGETLAYRENTDASGGRLVWGTGRLMVVMGPQATADVIEQKVGDIAMGGGRLAWTQADANGTIWTSNSDGTNVIEVAAPVEAGITVTWAGRLAATDGLVAWSVNATIDGDSGGGCCAALLSVWAPGEPAARFIEGLGGPDAVAVSAGWLVWHTNRDSLIWHDDGSRPDGFDGIPLTAVGTPWP
jgi:hypothetical protein